MEQKYIDWVNDHGHLYYGMILLGTHKTAWIKFQDGRKIEFETFNTCTPADETDGDVSLISEFMGEMDRRSAMGQTVVFERRSPRVSKDGQHKVFRARCATITPELLLDYLHSIEPCGEVNAVDVLMEAISK